MSVTVDVFQANELVESVSIGTKGCHRNQAKRRTTKTMSFSRSRGNVDFLTVSSDPGPRMAKEDSFNKFQRTQWHAEKEAAEQSLQLLLQWCAGISMWMVLQDCMWQNV